MSNIKEIDVELLEQNTQVFYETMMNTLEDVLAKEVQRAVQDTVNGNKTLKAKAVHVEIIRTDEEMKKAKSSVAKDNKPMGLESALEKYEQSDQKTEDMKALLETLVSSLEK